jgi:hypothetical protein
MTTIIRMSFLSMLFLLAMVPAFRGPFGSGGACAEPDHPKEILRRADEARGNLEGIEWRIEIESVERGRTQKRVLNVKVRNFNCLAEYRAPAKVKGQKVLMLDRNMWFIKPGLRKPVPISPRQKLLGEASNGDIASTNYAGDYSVRNMNEAEIGGEECYVFDLVADNKKVTYDRIKYWVSKERLLGVKAEFYTVSGKMFKAAIFEYGNSILRDGRNNPFISKMVITNAVVSEDVTTMNYSRARVGKIPDAAFNLNLLVR